MFDTIRLPITYAMNERLFLTHGVFPPATDSGRKSDMPLPHNPAVRDSSTSRLELLGLRRCKTIAEPQTGSMPEETRLAAALLLPVRSSANRLSLRQRWDA